MTELSRFDEAVERVRAIHAKKSKDYGTAQDPFANVRSAADWGVPSWVGAGIKIGDKLQRLKSQAHRGWVANESIEDSFLDIATYALIGLLLFEDSTHEMGAS